MKCAANPTPNSSDNNVFWWKSRLFTVVFSLRADGRAPLKSGRNAQIYRISAQVHERSISSVMGGVVILPSACNISIGLIKIG